MRFDCVILADGDFPTHPLPLQILKEAELLVCCDSAGRKLIENNDFSRQPDAIVGDGDSVSPEFMSKHADIYHHVTEQDYNDLTKATRFAISTLRQRGIDNANIAYIGTTGKREDHTIGNISLLAFYKREFGIIPAMVTDYGVFTVYCGDSTISTFPYQQVSIFNLSCTRLSSIGLKWEAYPYNELWQGTLNEALGTQVSFNADGEYIIYLTHDPKIPA